jgi:hypothetical protein
VVTETITPRTSGFLPGSLFSCRIGFLHTQTLKARFNSSPLGGLRPSSANCRRQQGFYSVTFPRKRCRAEKAEPHRETILRLPPEPPKCGDRHDDHRCPPMMLADVVPPMNAPIIYRGRHMLARAGSRRRLLKRTLYGNDHEGGRKSYCSYCDIAESNTPTI